jgi:dCTP deaminase
MTQTPETGSTPAGFWTGEMIEAEKANLFKPDRPDAVDCAAYTLRMGPEVYISPNDQAKDPQAVTIRTLSDNEAFAIPAGQFAFLLTEEIVTVPDHAVAWISMKAKIKWKGLINVSGFHVDTGFNGRLVFAVFNAGPVSVHLRRGQDLFLIWFANLAQPTRNIRKQPVQMHISPELISGIAGELQSLANLNSKIKENKTELENRIHSVEKEQVAIRVLAGIFITIGLAAFGYWLKSPSTPTSPAPVSTTAPAVVNQFYTGYGRDTVPASGPGSTNSKPADTTKQSLAEPKPGQNSAGTQRDGSKPRP